MKNLLNIFIVAIILWIIIILCLWPNKDKPPEGFIVPQNTTLACAYCNKDLYFSEKETFIPYKGWGKEMALTFLAGQKTGQKTCPYCHKYIDKMCYRVVEENGEIVLNRISQFQINW